jgi:hypothetical protein
MYVRDKGCMCSETNFLCSSLREVVTNLKRTALGRPLFVTGTSLLSSVSEH